MCDKIWYAWDIITQREALLEFPMGAALKGCCSAHCVAHQQVCLAKCFQDLVLQGIVCWPLQVTCSRLTISCWFWLEVGSNCKLQHASILLTHALWASGLCANTGCTTKITHLNVYSAGCSDQYAWLSCTYAQMHLQEASNFLPKLAATTCFSDHHTQHNLVPTDI